MTITAYHAPNLASPINDKRAGTIRLAGNFNTKILVMKGWDAKLHFAFRDSRNKTFFLTGKKIMAYIHNLENTIVITAQIKADPIRDGIGELIIPKSELDALEYGLYHLVITYEDETGTTLPMDAPTGSHVNVIEVVDFKTPSLNI